MVDEAKNPLTHHPFLPPAERAPEPESLRESIDRVASAGGMPSPTSAAGRAALEESGLLHVVQGSLEDEVRSTLRLDPVGGPAAGAASAGAGFAGVQAILEGIKSLAAAAQTRGSIHEFQPGGGSPSGQDVSGQAILGALNKLAGTRSRM